MLGRYIFKYISVSYSANDKKNSIKRMVDFISFSVKGGTRDAQLSLYRK
ncbi:hypothetical protein BTEBP_150020 [Brochothrix thermosphacta]|nr:hypothetical protein BTEBP_150020 [Brochothrix thermosphacta]